MRTAKTLQLLDANNNNISPAVCVDSLYFEQAKDETTYRMSLKNKMLVAGDNITINGSISGTDFDNVTFPSVNLTKVSGTGDIELYQLNTVDYKIGAKLHKSMMTVLDVSYYTGARTDASFLMLNGHNSIEKYFHVGTTDASLKISSSDSSAKISWKGGANYIQMNSSTGNMYVRSDVSVAGNKMGLGIGRSFVRIDDASVDVSCGDVSILSNFTYVNTNNTLNVSVGNMVSLRSQGSININSGSGNINLYPHGNGVVKIYDISVNNPAIDASDVSISFLNFQCSTNKNILSWDKMPILKVYTEDCLNPVFSRDDRTYREYLTNLRDVSICFKNIYFYDSSVNTPSYKPIVYLNDEGDASIRLKGLTSGTQFISLNGSDSARSVHIATINGSTLIGNTAKDIQLLTSLDTSNLSSIGLKKVTSGNCCLWGYPNPYETTHFSGTVSYHNSVYFNSGGGVYATAFYASSDERLKTGIKTSDITDFPEIKEFTWKDTSVKSAGFIAQDLENAGYDYLISEDDNGFKKVDYNAALSLKVASLENENKELKARIDRLEHIIFNK